MIYFDISYIFDNIETPDRCGGQIDRRSVAIVRRSRGGNRQHDLPQETLLWVAPSKLGRCCGRLGGTFIDAGQCMRILAIFAVATFFAVSGAGAFDIGGYRSGMTIEEVRSVSRSRGDHLIGPKTGSNDRNQLYDIRNALGASSPINFCGGKLATLSAVVPEGMKGFALLASDLIATHGNPVVSTMNIPPDMHLDAHNVTLSWVFGNNEGAHLVVAGTADGPPYVNYLVDDDAWCLEGSNK